MVFKQKKGLTNNLQILKPYLLLFLPWKIYDYANMFNFQKFKG